MKTRLLAMVLVVILVMACIPLSASADEPRVTVTKRAFVLSAPYETAVNQTDYNGMQNMFKRYMSSSSVTAYKQPTNGTIEGTGSLSLHKHFNDCFSNAGDNDINYVFIEAHAEFVRENNGVYKYHVYINGLNHKGTYLTMERLRNWLDDYAGHFVLLINACFSGDAIGRGNEETVGEAENAPTSEEVAQTMLNEFLSCDEAPARSGEFDYHSKYTVFCSSLSTELSNGGTLISGTPFGFAPYAWAMSAGYNILTKQNCTPTADINSDSIVTVDELYLDSQDTINQLVEQNPLAEDQTICYFSSSPYYSAFYFGNNPLGDVNQDKIVAMGDVLKLRQYLSGMITLSNRQKELADMNGDNSISMGDVLAIRQYLASM